MKVLMVEHFLPESIYTLELGRELKKYCTLSVFCRKDAGMQEEGIRWLPRFYACDKGKLAALADYAGSLLELAHEIRMGGYDIVHVQGFKSARFEMPLYLYMRGYVGKLVHTVHNLLPHEAPEADRRRCANFYHACDRLIVHNEACRKRLIQEFDVDARKIAVIPHGAYQTHMTAWTKGSTDARRRFLLFGYIRPYKGVDILLKALTLLPKAQRSRLHVTIAGKQYPKLDPNDYAGMIHAMGLEDCVDFLPKRIEEDQLDQLFAQADAALFPYREIYASGALLMAYTYGKPVIASDLPVFKEETDGGRTGLLFACGQPEALAQRLSEALAWTPEQVEDYQTQIRELVEHKYNWAVSAQKTAQAYQDAMKA